MQMTIETSVNTEVELQATLEFHCPKCPRIYRKSLPIAVQDGAPMCTVCEVATELEKMILE